jgi:hypothetical protein
MRTFTLQQLLLLMILLAAIAALVIGRRNLSVR